MHRRGFAAISVMALVLAGCTGFGGPGTPAAESPSPTPTPGEVSTPETPPPGTTTGACDRPTPRPAPDVRLINRLDEPRSLTVTVTPRDGSSAVYTETVTLGPDEDSDRFDVIAETGEYRISASLPDNTSASTVMEMEPGDRYSITTVIVREERILVERLGIHPEPTPTPCPS